MLSNTYFKLLLAPLASLSSNFPLTTISDAQVVPHASTNASRRVFRTWRRVWRRNLDSPILQLINRSIAKQNTYINIRTHACVKSPYRHTIVYFPTYVSIAIGMKVSPRGCSLKRCSDRRAALERNNNYARDKVKIRRVCNMYVCLFM